MSKLANYKAIPDVVSGYHLGDLFSVILPKERTNLVTNPSFETNVTGYTSVDGATLTRTTEQQRRGVFSLKVKPGLSIVSGIYFTASSLISGTTYAFSLDLYAKGGRQYRLRGYDGIRSLGTATFTSKGYWQRLSIVFIAVTTGAHRLYLEKADQSNTDEFYTDGWQFESCATGEGYATTYIDGDQNGFVVNQVPPAYYWTGGPHSSTSVRSAQTRAGGRVMNLKEYGVKVLSAIGLGMAPQNNVATPFGLLGGAIYQRTVAGVRNFTLAISVSGDNRAQVDRNRRRLEDSIKPDAVSIQQPMILRYQPVGVDGKPNGEEIDIVCNYSGGLEGSYDNNHQERIGLQFAAYYPYLVEDGEKGSVLDFSDNVTSVAFAMQRINAGSFQSIGSLGNFSSNIIAFAEGPDGSIYIGGNFTTIGGNPFQRIVKFNPSTSTFSNMGLGANAQVSAIAVGFDGKVYAAGSFTQIGAAVTRYVAYWDGVNWNAMGSGGAAAGLAALSLAIDALGNVYVGGTFSSMGGVAGTNGIAKWNVATQTWSALSTGVTSGTTEVDSLVKALDGSIWAAGRFGGLGGVANTNHIGKWDGTQWLSVASAVTGSIINVLAVDPNNGYIYAGGPITAIGGITVANIAYYNGVGWFPLGDGLTGGTTNVVYGIVFDGKGNVIIGGLFTGAGGLTLIDKWAIWNGSTWVYAPADLPGPTAGAQITTLFVSHAFDWYIGYNESSTTAFTGGIATITNGGIASIAPKFIVDGPGQIIQIDNFNSGDSIWFDLTLVSGERAVLDLTPGNISFKSSTRGNLIGNILPGSKLASFRLQPGDNRIGIWIKDAGANTAAYINWRQTHWDIAGAIRA